MWNSYKLLKVSALCTLVTCTVCLLTQRHQAHRACRSTDMRGVSEFHVTVAARCVVVWWGGVRMGPAYRTAATPERDGGEPCGWSRRSVAAEIHHTGQKQAGALNCSLTTQKATSILCHYILLSILTWLIIWVWHAMSCQPVRIAT